MRRAPLSALAFLLALPGAVAEPAPTPAPETPPAPAAPAVSDTPPTDSTNAANLGPTFKQGDKSRYELTNHASQMMKAPQGEMTVDIESTLTLACEVTAVDDTGATVTTTIEGIRTAFQSPMLAASFDSALPASGDSASQIAPFVRPLVGKTFTVKFNPTGSNADVQGVAELLPQGQVGQIVAQAIGAQGLGTAVVGFYVLKDGLDPVAEGAEWSDTQDAPAPPLGTISVITHSKLAEVNESVANIVVDGGAKFIPAPNADASHGTMTIDNSAIDGTIHWSTTHDMLQDLVSNSTIVISMTIPSTPPASDGPVTQTMRIVNRSAAKRLD